MAQLNQDDRDTLESLIDQHTLADVLTALANICHEKADHLQGNWQDISAARMWTQTAKKVETLSSKLYV